MEILSLKLKSKTNSNVFIAVTDNGGFLLHSDIIVSSGITRGVVDDLTFYDAVFESEILIATGVVMKYLGSHIKTERGIRDYLKKKDFSVKCVDNVIEKLRGYSIIDDRAYAESYIKSNPNYSRIKLREKLKFAGVDRQIIDSLIEDIDETGSCEKNATKYLKNKTLDQTTKEKLYRRLRGMGYSFETINKTINKLEREE